MRIAAVIVAGGRGTRMGGDDVPKQYRHLNGRAVIAHAIASLAAHPRIGTIICVISGHDTDRYAEAIRSDAAAWQPKLVSPAFGGASRQASALAGLAALATAEPPDLVLIHDAARPFVPPDVISRVIDGAIAHGAAIAGLPVADSLARADAAGLLLETVDRTRLWRAQTPQAFVFADITAAHRRAADSGIDEFTDDASLAAWAGMTPHYVLGSEITAKITTSDDLRLASHVSANAGDAQNLNRDQRADMETRTATGFDVHKFTDGDHVWLGGIKIPHSAKLDGHSDADVVLHALTDALLGCIGDGDIGQHFPPSDPKWKGAASILFVEDALRRIKARGGRIVNVDVTILAEAPKIGPHRQDMQSVIGAALGIATNRVGVKATTTETLGFTGRREGIAAFATATVLMPALDAI